MAGQMNFAQLFFMITSRPTKKKKNRSVFYRVSAWLHLWLGLVSGIIVVIVSITGAILTFEQELRVLLQPYQTVEDHGKPFLPPSVLKQKTIEGYKIPGISHVIYRGRNRSTIITWYGDRKNFLITWINPYTGKLLKQQPLEEDFYRIMLTGHYQLWLPRNIGQPLVAYATLIFVITLITGMVLWWPKKWTRSTRQQSFFIKTKASFKRLNYDLHNVLGFYSLLIALILALTGMVYGMKWFSNSVYWTASGGEKSKGRFERIKSDSTLTAVRNIPDEDFIYNKVLARKIDLSTVDVTIGFPYGKAGAWNLDLNPKPGTRYLETSESYEQHSVKLLKAGMPYGQGNGGDTIMKLNYDLHVGAIGGILTKIIAFLVCVISASLPITGFIIWLPKGNKKKNKKPKAALV